MLPTIQRNHYDMLNAHLSDPLAYLNAGLDKSMTLDILAQKINGIHSSYNSRTDAKIYIRLRPPPTRP